MELRAFRSLVEGLEYGKRLPEARYIYWLCDNCGLPVALRDEIWRAERAALPPYDWNLLKLHTREYAISFLSYPDFENDPHPALVHATKINLKTGRVIATDYSKRANPPILHRKETFLPLGDPRRERFAELTREEESAGLYRDVSRIGLRLNWESLLRKMGIQYEGHRMIRTCLPGDQLAVDEKAVSVDRHKTAIKRYDLSRPVKLLLKVGLLNRDNDFFDYGCGHGMDVEGLASLGYMASGWDPAFAPGSQKREAEVVNLGYVLNVIEDPAERRNVLSSAFNLAKSVLIVSVLVAGQQTDAHSKAYRDGFLTRSGTFQKFYAPGELESLIEDVLDRDPVTLTLGVCLIFRCEDERERFLSNRVRRVVDWTQVGNQLRFSQPVSRREKIVSRYDLHRELLDSLWARMLELGRIPEGDEFEAVAEIKAACGSLRRGTDWTIGYHGSELLQEARKVREEDVLVYLAMKRFDRRFLQKHLPERMRRDIKAFFGDFKLANKKATELLFASGDPDEVRLAVESVPGGWKDPVEGHFAFHRNLLDQLPGILRVYVYCGLRRFGELDETDVIKIHVDSGKLTLQSYDDFNGKPLPELQLRIKVDLRRDFVTVFDHTLGDDRQLLFFKERFVSPGYPFKNDATGFSKRLRKIGVTEENVGYGPGKLKWMQVVQGLNLTPALHPIRQR